MKDSELSESEEEKESKYQNIVYSQILSVVYNMVEFKIKEDDIKEFINNFAKANSLRDDFYQMILMTLVNINAESESLKKKDSSNSIRENLIDENHFNNSIEVCIVKANNVGNNFYGEY